MSHLKKDFYSSRHEISISHPALKINGWLCSRNKFLRTEAASSTVSRGTMVIRVIVFRVFIKSSCLNRNATDKKRRNRRGGKNVTKGILLFFILRRFLEAQTVFVPLFFRLGNVFLDISLTSRNLGGSCSRTGPKWKRRRHSSGVA